MSVDKGADSLTDSGTLPKMSTMEASGAKEELVSKEKSHQASDGRPVTAETAKLTTEQEPKDAARRWFESLSAQERVAAFGFVDGPFLATFLELASLTNTTAVGSSSATSGADDKAINWGAPVSLKDVVEAYTKHETRLNATDASSESMAANGESVDARASTPVDSDAFRIQHGSDVPRSVATVTLENDCLRVAREIFDQVCVVAPSVFDHVSGAAVDARHPFVTLQLQFFQDKKSDEELFLGLDSLSGSAFHSTFLSQGSKECDAASSLSHLLARLGGGTDSGLEAEVSLYALLLARFELALLLNYGRTQAQVESPDSLAKEEVSSQTAPSESPSSGAAAPSSASPETLIGDVISYAQDLSDLDGAVADATLKSIAGQLEQICSLPVGGAFASPSDIMLTPLRSMLLLLDRSKLIDVAGWNDAVRSSLKVMTELRDSSESATVERTSDALGEAKTPQSSKTQPPVSPGRQKKKKKKSKKKKRKTQNAPSNVDAPATVEVLDGEEQGEKADPVPPTVPVEVVEADGVDAVKESMTKEDTVESNEQVSDEKLGDAIVSQFSNETEETTVSVASGSGDDSSIKSAASAEDDKSEQEGGTAAETDGGITISRVEGVLVVATSFAAARGGGAADEAVDNVASDTQLSQTGSGDAWETVEVRGRGSRRKAGDRPAQNNRKPQGDTAANILRKKERNAASRKRNNSKKVAKDILSGVLDQVDVEVRKKAVTAPALGPPRVQPRPVPNAWGKPDTHQNPLPKTKPSAPKNAWQAGDGKKRLLRDVVAGAPPSPSTTKNSNASMNPAPNSKHSVQRAGTKPKPQESATGNKSSPFKWGKASAAADQNTVPTYQETVSATSTGSNVVSEPKEDASKLEDRVQKSDTDLGGMNEQKTPKPDRPPSSPVPNESAATPPLPTMLSPASAHSTSSSVASSLEVPHPLRRHRSKSIDVGDVGYHLLDVCDHLSRDMSLFMSRRAVALNTRRRERGALLAALQDNVAEIWPGRCHVEMYGSCATQMDLPSSDLDVMVRGMDQDLESLMMSAPGTPSVNSLLSMEGESISRSMSMDEQSDVQSAASFLPMSMHLNGERVMRLSAQLEKQPWAVQVNAIPTASVPVVKILADPSKLSAASSLGVMQHQQVTAQVAAAAAAQSQATPQSEVRTPEPNANGRPLYHPPPSPQPWRGSDVLNGLLKLDISFEGPEHGGIGSTEFSAQMVAEECQQTGLMPEATPMVQVLMVLKELLAQRKLNEPYSGGLSSYALLLLVVALMRERAVIREEIERVERQTKAVAAGDMSAFATAGKAQTRSAVVDKKAAPKSRSDQALPAGAKGHIQSYKPAPAKSSAAASSWASIAKKAPGSSHSVDSQSAKSQSGRSKESGKPSSFADAVARSASASYASAAAVDKRKPAAASPKRANSLPVQRKKDETQGPSATKSDSEKARKPKSEAKLPVKAVAAAAASVDSSLGAAPSVFSQGYNDVIEVLCSGETTAGKLLMHFLLHYGEQFDAHQTAIDISGKHKRDVQTATTNSQTSPFIKRQAAGSIDPITGMLTVDPIVIYDPLEGAEYNNVARRCFAWSSVRWIFAQSYATLSSAVERSASPPSSPGAGGKAMPTAPYPDSNAREAEGAVVAGDPDANEDPLDPTSPLLKCLLSF